MIGLTPLPNEPLEVADGIPSAAKLPLDTSSSMLAFQTATFGLG
jgi:hypothetical protein